MHDVGPTTAAAAEADAGFEGDQARQLPISLVSADSGTTQLQADKSIAAQARVVSKDLYQIVIVQQEAQDDSFVRHAFLGHGSYSDTNVNRVDLTSHTGLRIASVASIGHRSGSRS